MFQIRPAGPADIGAVDALLARAYPRLLKRDYPASTLVTALPLISGAQPALVTCGTYYLVFEGDVLLGAGGWTPAAPAGAMRPVGCANIRHVVTDDRAVRRGVGRALMGHILAEARAAGRDWSHCLSTRTAEPFYRAMGFERIGPVTIPLRAGIDFEAIEMRRDL